MEPTIPQRRLLWTVTDPRGLAISLAEDVWSDHVHKHPEIADYFEEIKLTTAEPDEIYFDPLSSAMRPTGTSVFSYYRRHLGRDKYRDDFVVVIVKSVQERVGLCGFVLSALLSDRVMKRLVLEWKK